MEKEVNVEAKPDRLAEQYRTADGIAVNFLKVIEHQTEGRKLIWNPFHQPLL